MAVQALSYFMWLVFLLLHSVEFSHCLITFNATVSLDGSGDYVHISDAIAAAPNNGSIRFYIHVKPGIYKEHIEVPELKTFISLIGDDASTTVIVDDRSNHAGFSTTSSATFTVKAKHFVAQFLTFQNSAGPENGQAVAVLSEANYTAYYKCVFMGYQDTLYVRGAFQLFKECDVYGSIDFIFGDGLAIFQDCNVYARILGTTITAQSKSYKDQRSGFTFQNCNVTVSPEIQSIKDQVTVSLGRPWRNYSTVIFMESFLDDIVEPGGWSEWPRTPVYLLFYAEYNNSGSGADTSQRVKWPGYHVLHNEDEASRFTVEIFIDGLEWLSETGIPFRRGLYAA
ncbi:probable pectinesterase/pectinesterase inhibitor 39 [Momordica charantia]|uniref:Pectinesterase n=1 Tax=Momordica charantia TaxID=3673 RepID=A0A6J1D381_MOMCH|nr:probable pectinesterase/pectinesterase inhibitor 39 [Momordica charantia]